MTVKRPMEHWDRHRICAECVNKECKNDISGNDYMTYSRDCERYECSERIVNEQTKGE